MATINLASANLFGISQINLQTLLSEKNDTADWFAGSCGEIALSLSHLLSLKRNATIQAACHQRQSNGADSTTTDFNNVIAISGDRGTGKSSVMHTILTHLVPDDECSQNSQQKYRDRLHALDELARRARQDKSYVDGNLPSLATYQFFSLPPIDPTKFPKNETLVGHVVANIYKQIIGQIESDRNLDTTQLDSILGQCDKVLEAIRIRTIGVDHSMRENPDDLDMLDKLANTSNLRSRLEELIFEFIKFKLQRRSTSAQAHSLMPDAYLVIAIDDLDTNIDCGYDLAEEIRNFFFIQHVIILMAVKIEQLSDVVQQHFMQAFSKILEPDGVLDVQPDEMATKYIQKLIPDPRRIHLPSLLPHSMRSIKVKTLLDTNVSHPLVEYFFNLVWQKSGIILLRNSSDSHGLIPLNLRGLHQIIHLLESMPSVYSFEDTIDCNRSKLHANLRRLEAWLVDSVSSNAVPRDLAVTFRRISGHPSKGINGFVVRQLREYVASPKKANLFGNDKTAATLLDASTQPQNISLGDILYLLNKIEQYNSSSGYMHYTAAIRLLYSIRLTAAFYPEPDDVRGDKLPEYSAILNDILAGLIYNPQIRITLTRKEWMYNRNTTLASLRGKDYPIDLKGDKISEYKDVTASMSLKDAVWLSFFVVQYGPRLRNGLASSHTDGAYITSSFAPETDAFSGYISLNWLAFAHNLLCPEETVHRLLGYKFPICELSAKGKKKLEMESYFTPADFKDAKEFLNAIIKWRNTYLSPLPLHCVDVVNGLIISLEHKRLRPRSRFDHLGNLNEFFHLIECIKKDFKILLQRATIESHVARKGEGVPKSSFILARLNKALEECPLLSASEVTSEYDIKVDQEESRDVPKRKAGQTRGSRKFDWILFS